MDRLLTPKHLSELLQVSLSTIYKWVHYKYVPYVKTGDLIRFEEKRVEKWVGKKSRIGRASYKLDINS